MDDDNDHTPTFDPDYEFDMDEGLEVGSVVTYLEATDPDLDELIYTVNGKDGDYFYADSVLVAKSGAIKINKVRITMSCCVWFVVIFMVRKYHYQ